MERLGVKKGAYAILTTHREENVDSLEKLRGFSVAFQERAVSLTFR